MQNATFTASTPVFATRNISAMAVLNWVADRARVAQQRRALAGLPLSALNDIGLTEAQAKREAAKPFWA